jgi:hypothetical protein
VEPPAHDDPGPATAPAERRDWLAWHDRYDDPASHLLRRLVVVRRRIGEVLDAQPPGRGPGPRAAADSAGAVERGGAAGTRRAEAVAGAGAEPPLRILSLCAGEGRDLLPELAARPGLAVRAVLVELDAELAARARTAAAGLVGVEVRQGDAGDPRLFGDVLPVDLLLLCGIFGNIADADIKATVDASPDLLAPGGTVIWTRGTSPLRVHDLRPAVRRWFTEAGFVEVAFDGAPELFGVGVARRAHDAGGRPPLLPDRLFTFVR